MENKISHDIKEYSFLSSDSWNTKIKELFKLRKMFIFARKRIGDELFAAKKDLR